MKNLLNLGFFLACQKEILTDDNPLEDHSHLFSDTFWINLGNCILERSTELNYVLTEFCFLGSIQVCQNLFLRDGCASISQVYEKGNTFVRANGTNPHNIKIELQLHWQWLISSTYFLLRYINFYINTRLKRGQAHEFEFQILTSSQGKQVLKEIADNLLRPLNNEDSMLFSSDKPLLPN